MAKTAEELETALNDANAKIEAIIKKAEKDSSVWPELSQKLATLEKTVTEKLGELEKSSNLLSSEKSSLRTDLTAALAQIAETRKAMEAGPGTPKSTPPQDGGDPPAANENKKLKKYSLI